MWWNPVYILLIIASTLTDFFIAKKIFITTKKSRRKTYLVISIIVNLLILFSFKYADFFFENIKFLLNIANSQQIAANNQLSELKILLPIGISFYTFQTVSYTIDVYRNKIKPERNIGKFALYVSFFPQLVAGPIERASRLLPQFNIVQKLDAKKLSYGLKLMFWGFFQKIVIADNLKNFVEIVYDNPTHYQGISIVLATLFFAVQIYCDFAGYTNIAIGAAHILGIKLIHNFKRPYFATSFRDFWQRWHISLSTWFKDYLYISLGGNRVVKWKWFFIILFTFIVSGFWHGANWTFIIWGGIHGLLYLSENILKKKVFTKIKTYDKIKNNKFVKLLRIGVVFVFVVFAWLFFRADNLNDAIILLKNVTILNFSIPFDRKGLLIAFILIALLFIVNIIEERKINIVAYISSKPLLIRWCVYYIMLLILIGLGNWGLNEFIYFQF